MDEVARTAWTSESLRAAGFVGWVAFEALMTKEVPQSGGVYIVLQRTSTKPDFLRSNSGGRFKDRDPTVDASVLHANWVDGAGIVYIGKADNLRRRLRPWRETPGEVPKEVETTMLADFRAAYGCPPFANDPHRLGR